MAVRVGRSGPQSVRRLRDDGVRGGGHRVGADREEGPDDEAEEVEGLHLEEAEGDHDVMMVGVGEDLDHRDLVVVDRGGEEDGEDDRLGD